MIVDIATESITIPLEDLDVLYGIFLAYGSIAEGSLTVSDVEPVMSIIGITPTLRAELSTTYREVILDFLDRKGRKQYAAGPQA